MYSISVVFSLIRLLVPEEPNLMFGQEINRLNQVLEQGYAVWKTVNGILDTNPIIEKALSSKTYLFFTLPYLIAI